MEGPKLILAKGICKYFSSEIRVFKGNNFLTKGLLMFETERFSIIENSKSFSFFSIKSGW